MLPPELIKFFKPKPEPEENLDPMLITDPRQLANYIKELRRRKQLTKNQYRNIIMRMADKQPHDGAGMNVRQWTYEEETLPNEGDKEIPLKKLHIKADLSDSLKRKERQEESCSEPDPEGCKFNRGDKVYVNESGMSRLMDDFADRYTDNVGVVLCTREDYEDPRVNLVSVKWQNKRVGPPDNVSIWPEESIDLVSTRTADLKDRVRTEIKTGDRVRVTQECLDRLSGHRQLYENNVGTVLNTSIYYDPQGQAKVKWDKQVGVTRKGKGKTEPLFESNFNIDSLQRVFS